VGSFIDRQHSSRILKAQSIALTGNASSTPSTDFSQHTFQVRIASTLSGWFRVGDNQSDPTAVIGDLYVPANTIDYITVSPGQRAAFISTTTTTGYLSLVEMT